MRKNSIATMFLVEQRAYDIASHIKSVCTMNDNDFCAGVCVYMSVYVCICDLYDYHSSRVIIHEFLLKTSFFPLVIIHWVNCVLFVLVCHFVYSLAATTSVRFGVSLKPNKETTNKSTHIPHKLLFLR